LYVDKERQNWPTVVELAGGLVEQNTKSHDLYLKLTYGTAGDKMIFLSFNSEKEHDTWLTKCVKVSICYLYVFMFLL